MAVVNKVIIGYWNCRGLVQPSILILEYLKIPYEFRSPSNELVGPPPKYEKTKWLEAKEDLLNGFDFPNLPYYHDPNAGIKLTHSSAILMHLARTNGLWPRGDEKSLCNADLIREEIKDLIGLTTGLCYDHNVTDDKKTTYVQAVTKRLSCLQRKLGDQSWFIGDHLTYVDFLAYDVIDHQRLLFPKILDDDFARLQGFMNAFESLPPIIDYLKSERYKKFPLWSVRAALGGSPAT
jgi:glutathione S-transferase